MKDQLLTFLQTRANTRGLVFAQEPVLLRELRTSHEDLLEMLEALRLDGAVEILSSLPFLALKLKKWSGTSAKQADSGASAYSYSKLFQQEHVKNSYRQGKTVADATNDGLLREILETLGETNPASFEKAVDLYSPHVIRTALDRVRRTKGIRKSKTALFRYLLTKVNNDSHAQTHHP